MAGIDGWPCTEFGAAHRLPAVTRTRYSRAKGRLRELREPCLAGVVIVPSVLL